MPSVLILIFRNWYTALQCFWIVMRLQLQQRLATASWGKMHLWGSSCTFHPGWPIFKDELRNCVVIFYIECKYYGAILPVSVACVGWFSEVAVLCFIRPVHLPFWFVLSSVSVYHFLPLYLITYWIIYWFSSASQTSIGWINHIPL